MSGQLPPNPKPSSPVTTQETRTRFFSQEYADIAKLRELSLKNAHMAAKLRHKAAKYMTTMERYRHRSTVLKEKAALLKDKIPGIQEQMKEIDDEIKTGAAGVPGGGVRPRDQSKLHLKNRKLQERIVKIQRKIAQLEMAATHRLAISSQKKVQADLLHEKAVTFDTEATNLNSRADRLQQATEGDVTQASPAPRPR